MLPLVHHHLSGLVLVVDEYLSPCQEFLALVCRVHKEKVDGKVLGERFLSRFDKVSLLEFDSPRHCIHWTHEETGVAEDVFLQEEQFVKDGRPALKGLVVVNS